MAADITEKTAVGIGIALFASNSSTSTPQNGQRVLQLHYSTCQSQEDQQCHSGLRYRTLRLVSVFLILLPQMQTYLSPYNDDKHYNTFFYMEFGDQEMHSD
jgi:predicted ferric reductase